MIDIDIIENEWWHRQFLWIIQVSCHSQSHVLYHDRPLSRTTLECKPDFKKFRCHCPDGETLFVCFGRDFYRSLLKSFFSDVKNRMIFVCQLISKALVPFSWWKVFPILLSFLHFVIPAEAGIQRYPNVISLVSRLRGNKPGFLLPQEWQLAFLLRHDFQLIGRWTISNNCRLLPKGFLCV